MIHAVKTETKQSPVFPTLPKTGPQQIPTEAAAKPQKTDRVEWSNDWDQALSNVLDSIKQQYPQITVETGWSHNENWTTAAADLGQGTHIILSQEFMDRMKSSREEFGKCLSALNAAIEKLSQKSKESPGSGVYMGKNQASFWSLSGAKVSDDLVQNSALLSNTITQNQSTANQNFSYSKKSSYGVSRHYSKVAHARSKEQVHQAMWDIRREIANMSMEAGFSNSEESYKAARAIRSLKKLLSRGMEKIRNLEQQEHKRKIQERAEEEQNKEKIQRLKAERKKMEADQKGRDGALIQEGRSDDFQTEAYIWGIKGSGYNPHLPSGDYFAPGDISLSGAMGDSGFAASDIALTDQISF